jgi:DNA-binding LytR/AlgR family response regulator
MVLVKNNFLKISSIPNQKHIKMKTYQQKGNTSLLILNHRTSKKILVSSVILLEGNVNYTTFYLENGKSKLVAHSIKFFEPYLETLGFLRVHRAYMVNPIHVKGYQREDESLMMTNGLMANISRRRKRGNNIEGLFK